MNLAWHADNTGSNILEPNHLRYADIDGDRRTDVCLIRSDVLACALMGADGRLGVFRPWSDDFGWNDLPFPYWETLQTPDLDGDGDADVCSYSAAGVRCALSVSGTHFAPASLWTSAISDATGWLVRSRYGTIRYPDVNGDGKADVCARNFDGIYCAEGTGTSFVGLFRTYADCTAR